MKESAFLLIKTNLNAFRVVNSVSSAPLVRWSNVVYGPWQIVAYVEADKETELVELIEDLRSRRFIVELDARRCKILPEDGDFSISSSSKHNAVLLINVDYRQVKEREVTLNLRKIAGITLARAMWGPADIIAIVEGASHEALRNLICDEVKIMNGVITNTTLYGYPPSAK